MKRLETQQRAVTNNLQQGLENSMREMLTADSLFALMMERKLKKKGVRLSQMERQRLRKASAEYLQSGDAAVLDKAITRKRTIRISIALADAERLERVLTGAVENAVTKTSRRLARSLEPEVGRWAHAASKWAEGVRSGF